MFIEGGSIKRNRFDVIDGNFDLNEISILTDKMRIPGGDDLKKSKGKNNMKTIYSIIFFSLLLAGCTSEPTLQKYFVENTEKDFIALDVSPSILNVDKSKLSAEQNGALESFDKMNVLAFKLNETNKEQFESERAKVTLILKDKKVPSTYEV
jgi:hypothetical protein